MIFFGGTTVLLLFVPLTHGGIIQPRDSPRKLLVEEENMAANMTQWIQNTTVKMYISSHLLLCPDQDLCFGNQFRRSYTYQQKVRSCSFCSCNDECIRMKNCCPWRSYVQSQNSTPSFVTYVDHSFPKSSRYDTIPLNCTKPEVPDSTLPMQSYFMISSCPNYFNNAEIVRRCEGNEHDNDYRRFQPVTSLDSNETFRNLDCALCHQEREDSVLAWEPKLKCRIADDLFQTNSNEELRKRLFAPKPLCRIEFLPLSSFLRDRVKNCTKENELIKQCLYPAEWRENDADIERGCYMDYVDPYTFCTPYTHFVYKNIFCAMCSVKNWTTDLMTECPEDGGIQADDLPFSALLDFSGIYENEYNQQRECPNQHIYDPLMKRCQSVVCESGLKFVSSECLPMHKEINQQTYEVNLIIKPTPESVHLNYSLLSGFDKFFIETNTNNDISRYLCSVIVMSNVTELDLRSEYHIAIHAQLFVGKLHDPMQIIQNFTEAFRFSSSELSRLYTIEISGQTFQVPYSFKFNMQKTLTAYHNPMLVDYWHLIFEIPGKFCKKKEKMPLVARWVVAPVTVCPRVVIHKSQTKVVVSNFLLCLVDFDFCIKSEYFKESPDKTKVEICVDQYLQGVNVALSFSLKSFTEERVLSIICLSLSSIGCVGSVVTFIIFDEDLHLHSLNIIFTSTTLLLANIFYFLSGVSSFSSFFCLSVGALTHFLWLSVMTWMTMSCFSIFRAFTSFRFTKSDTHKVKQKFFWNIFYSFLIPLIMVSVHILVNYFVFHDHNYGYSRLTCYISKPSFILYTFAIPLAVMVVLNVFMVLITMREIHTKKSPVLNSDNDRRILLIFFRLSTLTGAAWLFGFLHQIFYVQLFSYLHILTNGSQGLVIFFAFAVNLIVKRFKQPKQEGPKSNVKSTTLTYKK